MMPTSASSQLLQSGLHSTAHKALGATSQARPEVISLEEAQNFSFALSPSLLPYHLLPQFFLSIITGKVAIILFPTAGGSCRLFSRPKSWGRGAPHLPPLLAVPRHLLLLPPGSISCLLSLRYCCCFFFLERFLSPPDHLSPFLLLIRPPRAALLLRLFGGGVKIRFPLRSSGHKVGFFGRGLFVATGTRGPFLHSDFGLCREFAVISRCFAVGRKIPFSFLANTRAVETVFQEAGSCSAGRFGWKAWCSQLAPVFL